MVKTLPSNAGGAGFIPGRGAGIPHASWPKHQNIKRTKEIYTKTHNSQTSETKNKEKILKEQEIKNTL